MAPNDSDESKLVQGKYSIRWLETVFTSKAVTEELLSPERENGNLTTNDYERAIDFLPRAKQLKLAQVNLLNSKRRIWDTQTDVYLWCNRPSHRYFCATEIT